MDNSPSKDGSHRRHRRKQREQERLQQQQNNDRGSILWTLLLFGLVFCLADVAYILHYVDTQHSLHNDMTGQAGGSGGVASTTNGAGHGGAMKGNKSGPPPSPGALRYRERLQKMSDESGLPYEEIQMMDRQLKNHENQIYNEQNRPKQAAKKPTTPVVLTEQEREKHRRAKKPILDMFHEAGIKDSDLDDATLQDLPTWEEVTYLYGDEPVIVGLDDQCEAFQQHSDPAEHFVSTAGTFNSGTNLMAELLLANCHMQARMDKYGAENRGIRWQVPWGKHSPPGDEDFRLTHKTLKDAGVDATNIIPAVTIRDPYVWMGSMCRHEYTAHWHHEPNRHCPNLMPDDRDYQRFRKYINKNESIPVHVRYDGFWRHHESLAHLWNDWYREYLEIKTMNRLIVRFEDLLFHPKAVTTAVCKCAGGQLRRDGNFEYVLDSAKKGPNAHGPMESRTGFIKAIIKYGTRAHRHDGFLDEDLRYAKEHLDPKIMEMFRYVHD